MLDVGYTAWSPLAVSPFLSRAAMVAHTFCPFFWHAFQISTKLLLEIIFISLPRSPEITFVRINMFITWQYFHVPEQFKHVLTLNILIYGTRVCNN